ncbi:hypothetical protein ACKS0A_04308 [Histoplasma ohiense]
MRLRSPLLLAILPVSASADLTFISIARASVCAARDPPSSSASRLPFAMVLFRADTSSNASRWWSWERSWTTADKGAKCSSSKKKKKRRAKEKPPLC